MKEKIAGHAAACYIANVIRLNDDSPATLDYIIENALRKMAADAKTDVLSIAPGQNFVTGIKYPGFKWSE